VEQLSTDFSELRKEVFTLKAHVAVMSFTVTPYQNHPPPAAIPPSPQQLSVSSIPLFDLWIISHFPEIFAEFQKKRFLLLWRGSRDGFKVAVFHRRCDGHANTLTLILDTTGNIIGGFTLVKWESKGGMQGRMTARRVFFSCRR
jgi:hypothetical protein